MKDYKYKIYCKIIGIIRKILEFFGIGVFSKVALGDTHEILMKYLNYKNGFFIEAGANDGVLQSNTYYLEKINKWKGILIEPVPVSYNKCKMNRSKSKIFNCALVSDEMSVSSVKMRYGNLMSVVSGAFSNVEAEDEHIKSAIECQNLQDSYEIEIPARTLNSIIRECNVTEIDFMSIDVEGFEIEVFKGIDLSVFKPKYILVEITIRPEVLTLLNNYYDVLENIPPNDCLLKRKISLHNK